MGASSVWLIRAWMTASAVSVGVEMLVALAVVGFGLCALAMPRQVLRPLLFAPLAGLAVTMLANQWLTWFLPAPAALMLVLAGGGALTVAQVWRLRGVATAAWPDWRFPAVMAAFGIAAYTATLAYVLRRGSFTLAGFPSDPVHLYAPSAQWFIGHAFRPGAPVDVTSPILSYLDKLASRALPGSVGTLDAGLSVLTGWPVHALFDPLNALLMVLTAGATALLVWAGVGLSRWTAAIAFAAVTVSALLQWAVVSGYQQELEALPVLYGGLALALVARREGRIAAWALAGAVLAALPGLYLPAAVLALVLLGPPLVVAGIHRLVTRRRPVEAGAAVAAAAGAVLAAPSVGWIILGGGLAIWRVASDPAAGEGGVRAFYPLAYDVGTAPVTRFALEGWPLVFWHPGWDVLGMIAAIALIALAAIGLAVLVRLGRYLETAGVLSALLYLLVMRFVVQAPYGFVKSVAYLMPVVMGLAAIAVTGTPALRPDGPPRSLAGLLWPRAMPAAIKSTLGAALAGVVIMQAAAAGEVQLLANPVGGSMVSSGAGVTVLRTLVPRGSRVLLYDPHDWTKTNLQYVWSYEAAMYALTGHANVRMIVEGPAMDSTWYAEWTPGDGPSTTLLENVDQYDYVITGPEIADQLPASLRPVWVQDDIHLALYQRVGPT